MHINWVALPTVKLLCSFPEAPWTTYFKKGKFFSFPFLLPILYQYSNLLFFSELRKLLKDIYSIFWTSWIFIFIHTLSSMKRKLIWYWLEMSCRNFVIFLFFVFFLFIIILGKFHIYFEIFKNFQVCLLKFEFLYSIKSFLLCIFTTLNFQVLCVWNRFSRKY